MSLAIPGLPLCRRELEVLDQLVLLDLGEAVRVAAELGPDTIRLQVTDDGPGFNPKEIADPTLTSAVRRPMGRGLFLIRNLADRVEFNEQGNTIWMTLPRA